MAQITINQSICKRCRTCVEICPMTVFELKDKNSDTQVVIPELCISCGHCVATCNQNAIIHSDFPEGTIVKIETQNIPSHEQTLELIRSRRSIRTYKDKAVEKELIEKILYGSYFAQSAENFQNTHYIVIQDKNIINQILNITVDWLVNVSNELHKQATIETLSKTTQHSLLSIDTLVDITKKGRDMFLFNTPCLIFFYSEPYISFAEANVNLAIQNAALLAHSLGLGGFYTGYVATCAQKDKRISELLNVPQGQKIFGGITLGYPKYKFKNWIIRKKANIQWI